MNAVPLHAVFITAVAIAVLGAVAAILSLRSRKKGFLRQAPGSRIALSVNESFAPSDRFAGFVHEKSGMSIVLLELPLEAFEPLQALGHGQETLEVHGIGNATRLELSGRSGNYIYLRGEQNSALVDYAKYVLIFCEAGVTAMVSANVPRAALNSGMVTGAAIEKILASAAVRGETAEAPKLFTLCYLGPFEEDLSILGTTKGYRLKEGEAAGGSAAFPPLFLVAPSLSGAPIPNLSLLAGRSFEQIDRIVDKKVLSVRDLMISGLPAIEIAGRGADARTGIAALVYQLIVEARHGGYFRLIGLAPESDHEAFLGHFRKMAEGFSPA
ncbi:MAG: hypothetical protein ACLPPF_11250 [Rhodomicrobium sp.]